MRAEQQIVLGQVGGNGLAARYLPAGDVGPDAGRLRGVRILAVARVLPAQRLAVGQAVRIALAALGDAVAVRMHEHAQPQLFPAQGALQLRQLLQDDRAAKVGRSDPGRGIDLRGPRRAETRIGLEFIQQRHERAGLQLEQHPRYLAVGILLQSRRIVAVRHLVLFDGGGVDRRDMAGDVHDHDGMPGAGLVEVMAGGMPLLGYLRIVIAPADDGHAFGNGPGLLGELGHQLVHGVYRPPQQRAGKVHLIEVVSALTGKMPVPVHKAGIHGLAPQVHAAPDPSGFKVAGLAGLLTGSHEDDPAVPGGHDLRPVGVFDLCGFFRRFRHGVYLAIVINGIGQPILRTGGCGSQHERRDEHRCAQKRLSPMMTHKKTSLVNCVPCLTALPAPLSSSLQDALLGDDLPSGSTAWHPLFSKSHSNTFHTVNRLKSYKK